MAVFGALKEGFSVKEVVNSRDTFPRGNGNLDCLAPYSVHNKTLNICSFFN